MIYIFIQLSGNLARGNCKVESPGMPAICQKGCGELITATLNCVIGLSVACSKIVLCLAHAGRKTVTY